MRTFVERLISRWAISASQRQLHSVILCALDVCDFVLMRSCLGPREATWDKLCTTVWCIPTASVLFFAGASPAPSHLYVAGQFMKSAVVPKPYSYYLKLFDKATASIANTTDPEGFHPAITGTSHSTWLHRHTSLDFTATLHLDFAVTLYFTVTLHLTAPSHFTIFHCHTTVTLHLISLPHSTWLHRHTLLHCHTLLYFTVTLLHCHTSQSHSHNSLLFTSQSHFITSLYLTVKLHSYSSLLFTSQSHFTLLHCYTSFLFPSLSHFTSIYFTVTLHFILPHCHTSLLFPSLSCSTSLYVTVILHFTLLHSRTSFYFIVTLHFTSLSHLTVTLHFTLLHLVREVTWPTVHHPSTQPN